MFCFRIHTGSDKGNLAIYAVYVWIVCFHVCNMRINREIEGGSNGDRFKWSDHIMVVSTSQWFIFLATISIFIPLLIES